MELYVNFGYRDVFMVSLCGKRMKSLFQIIVIMKKCVSLHINICIYIYNYTNDV